MLTVPQQVNKILAFYGIRKFVTVFTRPPLVPIRLQISPVQAPRSFSLPLILISSSSMPRYFQWFLMAGLPTKTLHGIPPSPIHGTCHTYQIRLDLITLMKLGEAHKSCSSSFNPRQSHVTPSLLSPNIFLSTLFSDTLSTTSILHLTDQVSHSCKAIDKIKVLYILIFVFLDSKVKDKIFWTAQ